MALSFYPHSLCQIKKVRWSNSVNQVSSYTMLHFAPLVSKLLQWCGGIIPFPHQVWTYNIHPVSIHEPVTHLIHTQLLTIVWPSIFNNLSNSTPVDATTSCLGKIRTVIILTTEMISFQNVK